MNTHAWNPFTSSFDEDEDETWSFQQGVSTANHGSEGNNNEKEDSNKDKSTLRLGGDDASSSMSIQFVNKDNDNNNNNKGEDNVAQKKQLDPPVQDEKLKQEEKDNKDEGMDVKRSTSTSTNQTDIEKDRMAVTKEDLMIIAAKSFPIEEYDDDEEGVEVKNFPTSTSFESSNNDRDYLAAKYLLVSNVMNKNAKEKQDSDVLSTTTTSTGSASKTPSTASTARPTKTSNKTRKQEDPHEQSNGRGGGIVMDLKTSSGMSSEHQHQSPPTNPRLPTTQQPKKKTHWCIGWVWECLKIIGSLILLTVFGILQLGLMLYIYFRWDGGTGNGLGGTTAKWHGNAILSIVILLIVLVLLYLLALSCWYGSVVNKRNKTPDQPSTQRKIHNASSSESASSRGDPSDLELGAVGPPAIGANGEGTTSEQAAPPGQDPQRRGQPSWGEYVQPRIGDLIWKVCFPLGLVLFVLTEVGLLLQVPRYSILPLIAPFGEDANIDNVYSNNYQPQGCHIPEEFQKAKDFFSNNTVLDLDQVQILYGGAAFDTNLKAKVWDNTIYIPKYTCPSAGLLVHQLVHVWQEQTGYWTGKIGVDRAWDNARDTRECRSCMYDYGGFENVRTMWKLATGQNDKGVVNYDAADVTKAFGAEQMASLMEDYFKEFEWCHSYQETFVRLNITVELDSPSYPWHCEPLEFYANQILYPSDSAIAEHRAEHRAKDIFFQFDKNNSGTLTRDELVDVVQSLDIQATDADINALLSYLDSDGDAEITFSDFLPWFENPDDSE